MHKSLNLVGLLLLVAMFAGCSQKSLKQENALLLEENQNLRDQLSERNGALDATSGELRDKDMQLAQLRREMDGMSMGGAPVGETGFEGIAGVTGEISAGEVTAVVESDVLFDSGKSTLKSQAKRALDAVASVLNNSYASHQIRIGGHTDSDPIRKSGYKSNYHLGFERAFAVRDYLASRGVDAQRMSIASYGPHIPRDSKAKSRRVEIAVIMN
ncbi:MAG: OmpA/MotB family protein [Planctomycetota bacterium]|jgi:flagellar motor protein MotB